MRLVFHRLETHPQSWVLRMSTVFRNSAPMPDGMVPVSWLLFSSRSFREDVVLHSAGMVPLRSFVPTSTVTIRRIELHAAGSVPLSALPDTFSMRSCVRRPQLAGSDPLTIAALPLIRICVRGISDPFTLSLSSGRLPAAASTTSAKSSVTVSSVLHTTPGHAQ
ncbi:hypothetical protein NESM_000938700 [Novymonas esmeraldas]|uniref:Uncharacterized protein n=1 Tax=Novymonas esmeraldas TaxID=1808958 RepID=A0AAW0F0F5_9TRYP